MDGWFRLLAFQRPAQPEPRLTRTRKRLAGLIHASGHGLQVSTDVASIEGMTVENFINLFEEMVDLKIQQYAESNLKHSPEVSRLLREKLVTDRRRLDQIKAELVRFLNN